VGAEGITIRNGTGTEITILIGLIFVTAAPAIIPGIICIARDPGSNQNSTSVITIVRRIASSRSTTGVITIARLTGIGTNFGTGDIGRSTVMVTLDDSTDDRIVIP
jgi:hypothetical protein